LGKVIGPSLKQEDVPQVIETLITVYLQARVNPEERFVDVVERLGIEPFKTAVYGRKEVADEVVDG
jgi:sulfite reductase (NADPH) hemoprotein beta-component